MYDLPKDQFKVFADGEKVNSGSWSENPNVSIYENKDVNTNLKIILFSKSNKDLQLSTFSNVVCYRKISKNTSK